MTDPWGTGQPPATTGPAAPLPPRLERLARVQITGEPLLDEDLCSQHFAAAEELPEVQALMREGWRPLHPAPLYCLLPAAWPPQHRTWVPDRLPRVAMGGDTDSYWGSVTALPDDDDDLPDLVVHEARRAGLPDPPPDRIWLLRSPWPRIPVSVIYDIVSSVVEHSPGEDEIAQVYRVGRDVLTWDEQRALAACPAETRRLLDEWAAAGRTGEAAARPIELGVRPTELTDAQHRTGLDESALLNWVAALESDLDEQTVEFITAWHDAGLPGDPPPGADRFAERDPAELRTWIDAGFDLYAADHLELAGLATALRWRDAGFGAAGTYELLRADPALTPDEAHAFDDTTHARAERRGWIYYGFTAAEAEDWARAVLRPSDARLWRACGRHPADVTPGRRIPPQLIGADGHVGISRTADGQIINSEWEQLPDPPGTRGRRARRWRGDDDPWINTD